MKKMGLQIAKLENDKEIYEKDKKIYEKDKKIYEEN